MELNETVGQLLSRAILFRQGPETLLGRLPPPKGRSVRLPCLSW